MSLVVRIASKSVDEEEWGLVLDAALNGKELKRQLCFGFVSEHEGTSTKRWPIILRPLVPGSSEWVLDYGTDHEDPPQKTNLMEKEIAVGNYFTVFGEPDEVTFRIEQVSDL